MAASSRVRLSVNVNKVATLRNSRGGNVPDLLRAARVCVASGAGGITVHPRADARHIRAEDVRALHQEFASAWGPKLEFNIEGDPREDWLALVSEIRPAQATLVPVRPGEITSEAGWRPGLDRSVVASATEQLKKVGIRVSIFVDPNEESVRFAADCGADRIELYTEPFAKSFAAGRQRGIASFDVYARAALLAHSLKLGINAGHDLDLENLELFAGLPHLDEVSIGHAIWSEALFDGAANVIREYLEVLQANSR